MLHNTRNTTPPQGPQPRLTLEDGMTLWRARDVYRARRAIKEYVILALLLFAVPLALTLGGCEPFERGLAKVYGIKVDPLPGPCAPESFQARQCLAIQQEGKKP